MADATESTVTGRRMAIAIRAIEPADGDECARIVYEAFGGLHDYHRFPRDFPTLEAAVQLTSNFIVHPAILADGHRPLARTRVPAHETG